MNYQQYERVLQELAQLWARQDPRVVVVARDQAWHLPDQHQAVRWIQEDILRLCREGIEEPQHYHVLNYTTLESIYERQFLLT